MPTALAVAVAAVLLGIVLLVIDEAEDAGYVLVVVGAIVAAVVLLAPLFTRDRR